MAARRLDRSPALVASALAVATVLYFWLGFGLTIEWTDEGHLAYRSWRVSQGSLPARDWQHIYPPTIFLLEGLVMRWAGADLMVVRLMVGAVKLLIVLLVFALSRRVASSAAALLVAATLAAIWGMPLWVFHSSYASHYATACTLSGLLIALAGRGSGWRACAAGLALGAASVLKQTTGVLAYLGLLWFLLYERPPVAGWAPALLALGQPARWLRAAAIALPTLAATAYAWRTREPWTIAVLLTPVLATAGVLAWRERQRPPSPAQVASSLWQALCALAGWAVAPALLALYYWQAGALSELGRDALFELPAQFSWFIPYPLPLPQAALIAAAIAAAWTTLVNQRRATRRVAGALAVLCLVAALARIANRPIDQLWNTGTAVVAGLLNLLPMMLIWWNGVAMLHTSAPTTPAEESRQRALALLQFAGTWSLYLLIPAADVWHVLMALPIFFVLLAARLEPLLRHPGRRRGGLVFAVLLMGAVATPSVLALIAKRHDSTPPGRFARASGIAPRTPDAADAARLVDFLVDPARRERPIFVLSNQQMLYFLAARQSPFEREEFIFYLVGLDLIAPGVAAQSVDERRVVERLERVRPLVIDYRDSQSTKRLRHTFPGLGEAIERHYRPLAAFGPFEVSDWEAPVE